MVLGRITPLESIYSVYFTDLDQSIRITVTSQPSVITRWIQDVCSDRNSFLFCGNPIALGNTDYILIGSIPVPLGRTSIRAVSLEVETDSLGYIGTLQLYVAQKCLVIHMPHALAFPPILGQFLADPQNLFVGFDLGAKLTALEQQLGIGRGRRKQISELVLATVQDKQQELGELLPQERYWTSPFLLSQNQVHYASVDAFLNLEFAEWEWNNFFKYRYA